jgi:DNA primase
MDVTAIKAAVSLPELFERDGHHINGKSFCLCPFHEEHTPSCKVDDQRFHCFGCGTDGDAIEYLQRRDGCDFKPALATLASYAGENLSPVGDRSVPGEVAQAFILGDGQTRICTNAAERLIEDKSLIERVAKAKDWQSETIRQIAQEPSLGWHDGRLAFIYESGLKLRWNEGDSRRFKFEFGKAQTLWRAWLLTPSVVEVYVVEGETDAISLIDEGLEHDYQKTLVVAVPGASIIRPEWGPLFRGRHVILLFDHDPAGSKAFERFAQIARPYAAKVSRLNWKRAEALSAV